MIIVSVFFPGNDALANAMLFFSIVMAIAIPGLVAYGYGLERNKSEKDNSLMFSVAMLFFAFGVFLFWPAALALAVGICPFWALVKLGEKSNNSEGGSDENK